MTLNEFWNERYAEEEFAYGTLPNKFFKEQLDKLNTGNIVFVCEGEGRNAVYAAKQNWNVEAFDLSVEGMRKSLHLANQNKVTINYQIADAATIDYPIRIFDAAVLIFAHFPSTIRKTIHQKVVNWLRPGGLVILEAFNPLQLNNTSGGPKDYPMLYTQEMMREDFIELTIQQLSTEKVLLDEGKYHSGLADVIRFVGKKQE